jgi:soluble lytic murein transglycosylase-like protein
LKYLIMGLCLLISTPIGAALGGRRPTLLELNFRRAAYKHGLDIDLLIAVGRIESGLDQAAYNALTKDLGIMQINSTTALGLGLDLERLRTDAAYNVEAGALILAYFKARYAASEPQAWPCRYNVGTRKLVGRRAQLCAKYLKKLTKLKT